MNEQTRDLLTEVLGRRLALYGSDDNLTERIREHLAADVPKNSTTSSRPASIRASQWSDLYDAVNKVVVVLGHHGEISAKDDRVIWLMECLRQIDNGVYKPGLRPTVTTQLAQTEVRND